MKKMKAGFTLTEVLVTMGILGVIGTLLIPQLATNAQKNEAGVQLGRAVEQITLGFKNLIQHANDNSTNGSFFDTFEGITLNDLYNNNNNTLIRSNNTNIFANTGAFFGTTPLSETEAASYSVRAFNSNSDTFSSAISDASTVKYKSKSGMYYMTRNSVGIGFFNNWTPDTIINIVVIDVNGAEAPNRTGKDVFIFGITGRGDLIPAGTQKYRTEAGGLLGNGTIPTMEDACADNNVTNGLSCTARVVQDGFKIKYY